MIIKEADKGSVVVILNKTYYTTKIQEILKDETNYKLIDINRDNNIIKNDKILYDGKSFFSGTLSKNGEVCHKYYTFDPMLDTLNGEHLFLEFHVGDYHNLCRIDEVLDQQCCCE